jgi:hypothetical protein
LQASNPGFQRFTEFIRDPGSRGESLPERIAMLKSCRKILHGSRVRSEIGQAFGREGLRREIIEGLAAFEVIESGSIKGWQEEVSGIQQRKGLLIGTGRESDLSLFLTDDTDKRAGKSQTEETAHTQRKKNAPTRRYWTGYDTRVVLPAKSEDNRGQ